MHEHNHGEHDEHAGTNEHAVVREEMPVEARLGHPGERSCPSASRRDYFCLLSSGSCGRLKSAQLELYGDCHLDKTPILTPFVQ